MKAFALSLITLFFTTSAMANLPILNWNSKELSEVKASEAVVEGVRDYIENNGCGMVSVWGLEAINHLTDGKGNKVIVVWSTAQSDGSCGLKTYLDCSTSFHKIAGVWTNIGTTCEPEEVIE